MAILKNLVVNGSSRFLNKAYFQDVQIGGTATLSSLSLSGTLTVNGATTINNALNVTGTSTINKIIASNFIVNNGIELYHNTPFIDFHFGNSTADYTSRIIESSSGTLHIAQNLTIASTISAPTGVISTLNSTNVNVTNNLRANHYDLQTVAQLGGSFYVSPTVKFPNSGTTLAVAKSGTTLTLTIKDSSITSATMAGVVWTAGSGVKVSGTINDVVTGTMDGTVSSINTSSHTLTLSVSGENSGNVQASPSGSPYTASQFKDLSVMLYTRKQDGTNKMINTASGAIASFTDGGNNVPVKQLVVDIEPVQDLHGYDAPWAGGGGKNLLQNTAVSQTIRGVTFTINDDGTIKANGTATGGVAGIIYLNDDVKLSTGQYTVSCNNNGNYGADTGYWYLYDKTAAKDAANPNITTFTADSSHTYSFRFFIRENKTVNAIFYPMIRLSSVTDASYAPYSNICPISGHTSAVVTRSKKNLLKNNNTATTYTNNGVTFTTNSNGTITANGTATADAQVTITITGLTGKVKFTGCPSGGGSGKYDIYPWDPNINARPKKWDGTNTASGDFGGTLQEILIPFGHSIQINCRVSKNYTANNVVFSPMIVSPTETSTTFESYSGQQYTISLNGTRYGGTLDVGTGVLTVTHKCVTFDGVTSGHAVTSVGSKESTDPYNFYQPHSDGYLFKGEVIGGSGWVSTGAMINYGMIYSHGAVDNSKSQTYHLACYVGGGGTVLQPRIFIPLDAGIDTVAKCNDWLAQQYANGTPVQYIYPLAEPFTVQLSHTEVRTLSGYNNIWSNTGDTNVIYESSQVDSTNNYNVGIWMNCYDQANSSSTIRVYNGSSRWPNVFLGNMTNADLPRVNGNEPYGYGLYSDNVFLRGIISATGGLIGNWTIGTTGMFYNSDAPGSTSITMIPGGTAASTTSIGGSSGSKSWIFTGKNLFGIDTTGKLYASSAEISGKITATSGNIGGWSVWANSFGKTTDTSRVLVQAMDSPTSGNWAIRVDTKNSADTDWTNRIHLSYGGEFFANNAEISGKITATSGSIGGFHITSSSNQGTSSAGGHIYTNSLYRHSGDGTTYEYEFGIKGDAAENPSSSNSEYGNLAFYVKRINKGAAWNGTNTNMFYVTHKGVMYCREAEITGKITATSGAIAGWRIESTYLASGTATAPAANTLLLSPAGTSSSYTVAGTAKSGWMITAGTTFGVNKDGGVYATSGAIGPWHVTTTSIYKAANTLGSTTSGAAYFGDLGLSVGNKFKVDASGVVTLGLSNGYHATMDTDSFDVLNGSTMLATFGTDSVIGNMSTRCVSINSDGFKFNSAGKTAFNVGIDNRSGSTASEATGYTFPSNPEVKYINSIPYYLLTTISSDRTVIEVDVYAEMADPEAESRIFFDWVVDNNKLYINCDEVDQKYDAAIDYVSYIYTTNTNTQAPYCIIGDNAYSSSNTAGTMSFAQGYKCLALGAYSTSVGQETLASGTSSFSLGKRSEAHGTYSFAGGALSTSKDFVSFAYGYKSNAWGKYSVAFGNQDLSTWIFEILITSCDTQYGDITFKITQRAETFEDYISTGSILVSTDNQYIFEDIVVTSGSGTSTITFSCVLYGGHFPAVNSVLHVRVNPPGSYGNGAMSVNACCASGISSTALGIGTAAAAGGSLAIGMYNIPESNVLFSIGNGTMLEKHNAMTVDLLGNVVASGNIACTGISAPLFIEKSFQTGNLSVGANAAFSINFNQLSGYSIPNGYRAIAFSHISVNNNYLYFRWMNPVSSYNGAIAVGRNSSSATQSFVLQVRIIFALTSLFGT